MDNEFTRPAVLVLAAGRGTRFNDQGTKLLAGLRGCPLIAHSVAAVRASQLPMRLVVSTAAPPALVAIAQELAMPEELVWNSHAASGVGNSVALGLLAARSAPGWLVLPADMPNVQAEDILSVARTLEQGEGVISARPVYQGQAGYPVGFSRRCGIDWESPLMAMGLRLLKAQSSACLVQASGPGVVQDVDTSDDLTTMAEGARKC